MRELTKRNRELPQSGLYVGMGGVVYAKFDKVRNCLYGNGHNWSLR